MTDQKIILNTDSESAALKTITGWVSRHGRFYGNDERIARWDGCTHIVCECGKSAPKGYTHCRECIAKRRRERWLALPLVEWDGKTPLTLYDGDECFFDADELHDWCDSNGISPRSLMLVTCKPQYLRQIDTDYWSDDLPEDGDLPAEVEAALQALQAAISAHKEPVAWYPGEQRVIIGGDHD